MGGGGGYYQQPQMAMPSARPNVKAAVSTASNFSAIADSILGGKTSELDAKLAQVDLVPDQVSSSKISDAIKDTESQ